MSQNAKVAAPKAAVQPAKAEVPAVAAPEVAKEVDRNCPANMKGVRYKLGGSVYNPRAAHNILSWERMLEVLTKAGDKGAAGADLAKVLTVNDKHPDKTHFDFVGYLERRGALTSVK